MDTDVGGGNGGDGHPVVVVGGDAVDVATAMIAGSTPDDMATQAMVAECEEEDLVSGGQPVVGAAVVIEHEPIEAMDTQEDPSPDQVIPYDIHSDDAAMIGLAPSPESDDPHHNQMQALAPDDTMPVAAILTTPSVEQQIEQQQQLTAIVAQQQLEQLQQENNPHQQHQPPLPPLARTPAVLADANSTTTTTTPISADDPNAGATITINDAPMHDHEEETRSEASFRFRVENFSRLRESVLSPPTYVRNLPWKIMVMPRHAATNERTTGADSRSLGFFLQCNGDSESTSWSCNAMAELRIISFKPNVEPFGRKIKHLFYSKENDWGFSHFMNWSEILDPEKGFVHDDCIELEVTVSAEAPHGVFWDSKKHTGYVGLKNQGATCYMNSLLQTLYFTNQLRRAVYKMPTEADDSAKSVGLALQRVFHDLQFLDKPVGTKKLTKSFGWEALDSFMQHDVQEFLRVLLDKLENKMKQTCVEGTVPRLFEGKMSSYIKCKNVDYQSTRMETFYDIQLNIKGKKNIAESFRDYIDSETLEGDNKYDAGEHGLQEAEKGVIFVAFPPVLHLHLMRFQYDPITDNSVKFNDRFEFYEHMNLDDFLHEPRLVGEAEGPADYTLHAVLVHSGDNHGGHYVVYINPLGDGRWCKFDDDVVSRCTKAEAIDQNYGGVDDDITLHAKHCSNAYMLVYIRDSEMPAVLGEIRESEIPAELIERLHEERRMEQVRRRERSEANTFMTINVLLEEYFEGHQTTDLFDIEKVQFRQFKLKKTQTVAELIDVLVEEFRTTRERMRIWPLLQRHNQVTRLTVFDWFVEQNKPLINCADLQNPWPVFLQLVRPDAMFTVTLPPFDRHSQVFIFFKFYAPAQKRLNFCGSGYYALSCRLSDLVPEMCCRAGFPIDTRLTIYEEQGANIVQRIINQGESLDRVLKMRSRSPQTVREIDGVVLIFEKYVPPSISAAAVNAASAAVAAAGSPYTVSAHATSTITSATQSLHQSTAAMHPLPPINPMSMSMSPASPASPDLPTVNYDCSDEAVPARSSRTGRLDGSGFAGFDNPSPVIMDVKTLTPSCYMSAANMDTSSHTASHPTGAAATVTSAAAAAQNTYLTGGGVGPTTGGGGIGLYQLELPTCEDYFRDMLYRVEVVFIDKATPNDAGFVLELSQRMSYDQMATAVGFKINSDPYQIQFFKCQNYKDIPGHPLRCSYDGSLKDLLVYNKPKSAKKIFYQRLSMNITELESKKQFKCQWHSINLKDEKDLILFPNKSGTVRTLLDEAAKQVDLNPDEGSGHLRIVEVNNCKVMPGPNENELLEYLHSGESTIGNQKVYRIEEIPRDELNLLDDEMLLPINHFYKDVYNVFGVPFYVRAKQGEMYGDLKERIRRKLALPDKEWEKYKMAMVTGGRYEYIMDDEMQVNLADFRQVPQNSPVRTSIALEHVNKTQKRARFNYLEKAIKIYN